MFKYGFDPPLPPFNNVKKLQYWPVQASLMLLMMSRRMNRTMMMLIITIEQWMQCSCTPGWRGVYCDTPCPVGRFSIKSKFKSLEGKITVYTNPGGARNVFKSAAAETALPVTMWQAGRRRRWWRWWWWFVKGLKIQMPFMQYAAVWRLSILPSNDDDDDDVWVFWRLRKNKNCPDNRPW